MIAIQIRMHFLQDIALDADPGRTLETMVHSHQRILRCIYLKFHRRIHTVPMTRAYWASQKYS